MFITFEAPHYVIFTSPWWAVT